MLGFGKTPWGDSVVGASSLTPLENLKILKLLGQGEPREERWRGRGSPQSAGRALLSVAGRALSGKCTLQGMGEGGWVDSKEGTRKKEKNNRWT